MFNRLFGKRPLDKPEFAKKRFAQQPSSQNQNQNTPLIELQQLAKSFVEGDQERTIFSDLSINFERGQFIVILGHSGSGKSTLLNLISGIEKPDGGDVVISGIPITQLQDHDRTLFRRDNIGFVFQFFNQQLNDLFSNTPPPMGF